MAAADPWGSATDSHGGLCFCSDNLVNGPRLIDPHVFWLFPAANVAAPACGMEGIRSLMGSGALPADGIGLTVIALIGCHVLDATMAMFAVVPGDECQNPLAGRLFSCKNPQTVWLG